MSQSNTRALAILRVSSHRQKDSTSHEVQEREIQSYAEREGLRVERIAKITESAKDSENRKQYSEAISWALGNDARHVLFYMYDRESRNLTDNERNEKLVRAGLLTIHYVRDAKRIDHDSPDSDFFMRDIQAVTNKQFVRNLSAKVKDSFRAKAESGWFPMNHLWLGYKHKRNTDSDGRELKRGTTIVIDKKTAPIVLREFELKAQGLSLAAIRKRIIEDGLVTVTQVKRYKENKIHERLRSKFYRGYFDFQGKEYKGKHEIFIPQDILQAVEETFGKRAANRSDGIFGGGWLTCTQCGCFISHEFKKNRYHYYHCSNGKREHGSLRGFTLREESIWDQFSGALDAFSVTEEFAKAISQSLKDTHNKVVSHRRREIEDYRLALVTLETKEDELYSDLKAKVLSDESYRRQIDKVRSDRHNFTKLLEAESNALDGAYLETANSILELAKDAKSLWLSRSPKERRKFLEEILSNRSLDGVIVRYELKKPFAALAELKSKPEWRPHLDNFRTSIIQLAA